MSATNFTISSCDPATIEAALNSISSYNYVPTQWIAILYLALFGTSTVLHFTQAIWFRLWFLLPTVVLCGALELVGWGGRLWSSINHIDCANLAASTVNVDRSTPFLMQIVTTIIAPTPLIGANFILFGRVIYVLGPRYSRLSAKYYSIIFLTCDIIALIVQGAGGGIASSAAAGDRKTTDLGGHIMLGGIVFQLVAITVYSILAIEFLFRYVKDMPVRRGSEVYEKRVKTTVRMKLLLLALMADMVFLFIRSVYRTIELSDGWSGSVISTEWLFNVFDAAMIVLAMYTLNFLHPGFLLIPEERRVEAERAAESRDSIQVLKA